MPTIDQNGNAFSTAMNIGTLDDNPINFLLQGTSKVSIRTDGYVLAPVVANTTDINNGYVQFTTSGLRVYRHVVDSNNTIEIDNNNADNTGHIQVWRFVGVGQALMSNNGTLSANGLANLSNINSAFLSVPSTGTVISRNVADGNAALTVNQAHASSTGNLLTLQKNSATVAQINTSASVAGISIQTQGSDSYLTGAVSFNTFNAAGSGAVSGGNTFQVANASTPQLTIDYQGDITVLGAIRGTTGMGPLSLSSSTGVKVSNGGFGAVFFTPGLTADRLITMPDAAGTSAVINTTAPSSASDTGVKGEIRVTSTYVYVCISTDTWVRAPFATF